MSNETRATRTSTIPRVEVRRVGALRCTRRPLADRPDRAAEVAWRELSEDMTERLVALLLDSQSRAIAIVTIAQGGLAGCACTPSDVLRPAIVAGARSFILAHNHPSGDPTPSREDLAFTTKLAEVAAAMGVPMLDHLTVAELGWASCVSGDRGAWRVESKVAA